MAACFCGCGREVSGLRTRAQNTTGARLDGHLDVLEASLGGDADAAVPDLDAFVDEGRTQRRLLVALVHGDLDRKRFDKGALLDWIKRAEDVRDTLATTDPAGRWEPSGPDSVTKAPRVGDHVEVAYDATDPNHFVYRPLIKFPGT